MARAGNVAYECSGWLSTCPVGSGSNGTCLLRTDTVMVTFPRSFLAPPTLLLSVVAFDGCATRPCPRACNYMRGCLQAGLLRGTDPCPPG